MKSKTHILYKTSYGIVSLLNKFPGLSESEIHAIRKGFYKGSIRQSIEDETGASKTTWTTSKNECDRLRWLLWRKIIVRMKGRLKDPTSNRKKYFYFVNPKVKLEYGKSKRGNNIVKVSK